MKIVKNKIVQEKLNKHTWKIGASGSLLIATMVLESFIPAKC